MGATGKTEAHRATGPLPFRPGGEGCTWIPAREELDLSWCKVGSRVCKWAPGLLKSGPWVRANSIPATERTILSHCWWSLKHCNGKGAGTSARVTSLLPPAPPPPHFAREGSRDFRYWVPGLNKGKEVIWEAPERKR